MIEAPNSPAGRLLPPGTPIFGLAYSDGSVGCWQANREAVVSARSELAALGFGPIAVLTLRMKADTLVELV